MKTHFKIKYSYYKNTKNFYYKATNKNQLGKFHPIEIIMTSVTSIRPTL